MCSEHQLHAVLKTHSEGKTECASEMAMEGDERRGEVRRGERRQEMKGRRWGRVSGRGR